jgi:flavin reductase (DIM6/NTAB) family NADH-FMN oxidoreductase RutF
VQPDDASYALLRHLTSPIVAITTATAGRRNGLISNSAQRASLLPGVQRISVYLSKINLTHDLVMASGIFALHLLRRDQWDVIWKLGMRSGREGDKFDGIPLHAGVSACPLIADALVAYECRVVNAMDAGAATFFLGEVVSVEHGTDGPVMDAAYFRANMPDDMRRSYEANLATAQQQLAAVARTIRPAAWKGPVGALPPGDRRS